MSEQEARFDIRCLAQKYKVDGLFIFYNFFNMKILGLLGTAAANPFADFNVKEPISGLGNVF